jgi:EAL domain-containing protein (putative c-di-GMP-specific phosphodiesterase class I)
MMSIGAWALGEACSQGADWCRRFLHLEPFMVSVNLSARQFTDVSLTKQIATILVETGLSPACLTLELTETHMTDDVESTIEQLRSLKSMGVSLTVDNYGTGYSSLANLKPFPVDSLKIDPTFVRELGSEPQDIAIVSAMIGLGHALGLRVVADGVESANQLDLLRQLMCDLAQGHYVSDAVPPEMVSNMLADSSAGRGETKFPCK